MKFSVKNIKEDSLATQRRYVPALDAETGKWAVIDSEKVIGEQVYQDSIIDYGLEFWRAYDHAEFLSGLDFSDERFDRRW